MIQIHSIPCLQDNFAYLVVNEANKKAILIDVPEAAPIRATIEKLGVHLEAVLLTHHHADHVQGLKSLDMRRAVLLGAKEDAHRLPPLDHMLTHDAVLEIADMRLQVLPADGHTIGHIAFYFPAAGALFSGDSLMFWGCGRLFEGTPRQMFATLEYFNRLPEDTLIFSGHDYGQTNGRFALSLDPDHLPSLARFEEIKAQNEKGEAVMPVTLGLERETNPFLRVNDDDYAESLGIADKKPAERFAHIRKLRDQFS